MSIANFIPTIWSTKLNEANTKALVYGSVVNTDYEGEIKDFGDKVKINSIGDVTISDFTGVLADPEDLNSSQLELVIDQKKSFNFKVEDVDKAQANVSLLDKGIANAGIGLKNVVDNHIASLYVDVDADNVIGDDTTPIVPTSTTAYDFLVDLGVKLDEKDCPSDGRWVVVPPWFEGLLLKDPRFTRQDKVLENGVIGSAANFEVRKSNNVPHTTGTKYKILGGHDSAISFAGQVNSIEAYRPEKGFSDAVKGLYIYGLKTIKPENIAVITANKS